MKPMAFFIIAVFLLTPLNHIFARTIEEQLKENIDSTNFSNNGGAYRDENKSVSKAVFFSLLLPGLGQKYTGNSNRMYPYLGAEAVTWSVYGLYKNYSRLRENDYKLYAAVHAGIAPEGKDAQYFSDIEDYMDSDEYNEQKLREARLSMYSKEPTLYSEAESWKWESQESYEKYQKLRHESWLADKKATYTLGFAILNRIISAIDAAKQAKVFNRDNNKSSWNIKVKPLVKANNYGGKIVFNYKR